MLISLLLVIFFMPTTAPTTAPAEALRVVSCNVRNSHEPDGVNVWANRREALVSEIRKLNPDLLGTQEVLADQYDDLSKALSDYVVIGVARADGKRKGEWAAIFVRKSRFDMLDSGNFWLSETPEVVGSRGWDAALERICTWAKLHDKITGRDLLFANTHFDHRGEIARNKSAKLLAKKLPQLAGNQPLVLTGDFNSDDDSRAHATLIDPACAAKFTDAFREAHPIRSDDEASFNGWKEVVKGKRIDWILHSPHFLTVAAEIDRSRGPKGEFLTDHYLVWAILH